MIITKFTMRGKKYVTFFILLIIFIIMVVTLAYQVKILVYDYRSNQNHEEINKLAYNGTIKVMEHSDELINDFKPECVEYYNITNEIYVEGYADNDCLKEYCINKINYNHEINKSEDFIEWCINQSVYNTEGCHEGYKILFNNCVLNIGYHKENNDIYTIEYSKYNSIGCFVTGHFENRTTSYCKKETLVRNVNEQVKIR